MRIAMRKEQFGGLDRAGTSLVLPPKGDGVPRSAGVLSTSAQGWDRAP